MKFKLIFLYTLLFLVCKKCNAVGNHLEDTFVNEAKKNPAFSNALKELNEPKKVLEIEDFKYDAFAEKNSKKE